VVFILLFIYIYIHLFYEISPNKNSPSEVHSLSLAPFQSEL